MADRFWVLGSGNWSDTGHWSATSGGSSGASVPTSSDNAIFNAASNATAYTVTIDVVANCLDLNFAAAPSSSGTITWSGSSNMNVFGNVVLLSGMQRSYFGVFTFKATSAKTITSNGAALTNTVHMDGVGGSWTLQDNLTASNTFLTLDNGTFNTNAKTVSLGAFLSANTNTRTVTISGSAITLSSTWDLSTTTNLTLNINTSTSFILGPTTFIGGSLNYGCDVTATNLPGSVSLIGDNTFRNGTFSPQSGVSYGNVSLSGNQTFTGTLSLNGTDARSRLFVNSNFIGTARTLTAAVVSISDVDFADITGAGAGSWTGTRIGNCRGNSNITFTTAATKYWVNDSSANWDDLNSWATSSGGAGATNNYPLPQDSAVFDAASYSTNRTLTIPFGVRVCSVDFSANDVTLSVSVNNFDSHGDIKLKAGMSWTGGTTVTFSGKVTQTLTTAGVTIGTALTVNSPGGTLVLADNLTMATNVPFTFNQGTLNLNGKTLSLAMPFNSTSGSTRAITAGGGVVNSAVSANNALFITSTGLTCNDTVNFNLTYSGSTGIRSIIGTFFGSTPNLNVNVTAGTDTVNVNSGCIGNLDFTGFAGTWDIGSASFSLGGSLKASTGMTITGNTGNVSFVSPSGTSTITSNGKTLDFPITFNATGGAWRLVDALTVGSTRLVTLTSGTFNMNGLTASMGSFASSNSNVRSITTGGATITLTGNNTTVWSTGGVINFTLNDALTVASTYSGSVGTRTFSLAAAETTSFNLNITAGTDTVQIDGSIKNLDFTGFAGALVASAHTVYGNLTLSTGMSLNTGGNAITFGATSGTKTITSNGKTIDRPVAFDGVGGTWQLVDAMTVGSTRDTTLTNGTLNLNGIALSTGTFSSNNLNTRSITSGGATLTLTGNNNTIWNLGTFTNFTLNDVLQIDSTYSGSVGTRIFSTGSGISATNAPNIRISAGTDTVSINSGHGVNKLDFTGFSGSWTGSSSALSCYDNLILSTGMTVGTSSGVLTFGGPATSIASTGFESSSWVVGSAAPSGYSLNQDTAGESTFASRTGPYGTAEIVNVCQSLDTPAGDPGPDGGWGMGNSISVDKTKPYMFVCFFKRLSTGLNTGASAYWGLHSNSTSDVLDLNGSSNTNPYFCATGISTFMPSADTWYLAIGFVHENGYGSTDTGISGVYNLSGVKVFSGIEYKWPSDTTACGHRAYHYYNQQVSGEIQQMTRPRVIQCDVTSAPAVIRWVAAGPRTITNNGKTFDRPITFDTPGGTWKLADAMTVGSTRATTLTNGILDINGLTLSTGQFSTSNSNVRTITSTASSGKIATTDTTATTVFNATTSTNLTVTRNSWTIEIGGNTTSARTFAGGNLAWPTLTFTNTTANGRLDFTGSNTFKSLAVSIKPQSLRFTSSTTTTIEDDNGFPSGTAGNLITINTVSGTGTFTLTKAGSTGNFLVSTSYLSVTRSTATPAKTWLALTSTNGGTNSGWSFSLSKPGGFMGFFIN
jgi:hypothetical protein